MSGMDALVEELDRSFREVQERMSDPAVYNDHREAARGRPTAEGARGPHKLAQEWQTVRDDLDAARSDSDLRELLPGLEERLEQLEDRSGWRSSSTTRPIEGRHRRDSRRAPAATRPLSGRATSTGC